MWWCSNPLGLALRKPSREVPFNAQQAFVTVDKLEPPVLDADGGTPMGEAVQRSLGLLRERKEIYKQNGLEYFRPWMFVISDGKPTDKGWEAAADQIKQEELRRGVIFYGVGVENADMRVLSRFSDVRPPLKLRGLAFDELFMWLSKSLSVLDHLLGDSAAAAGEPLLLHIMPQGFPHGLVVDAFMAEKGVVLGGHDRLDSDIGQRRDGYPDAELPLVVVCKGIAVPVQDLGRGSRAVVFQDCNVGKVPERKEHPDRGDQEEQRQSGESPEEDLFYGTRLLLPGVVLVIVVIPPTGGTRVDASAAAAAAERADHEQERDADEDVEELII